MGKGKLSTGSSAGPPGERDVLRPEEAEFFPTLFRHDDLVEAVSSAEEIPRKKLVNILNYLHFSENPLHVLLSSTGHRNRALVRISHEPCLDGTLSCRWDESCDRINLKRYTIDYLVASYNQSLVIAPVTASSLNGTVFTLTLPEQARIINERQLPRFPARQVKAELWQQGFQAEGILVDVSRRAFRIDVTAVHPSSFYWLNGDASAILKLWDRNSVYYTGECTFLYQERKAHGHGRHVVLTPTPNDEVQRFPAKEHRNPRFPGGASLFALFEHPLVHQSVQREILDISTSGFSIADDDEEAVLMPGLIIPKVTILYAGVFKIQCKAQVVYRREKEGRIRFGMVALDMDVTNYKKLNLVLSNIGSDKEGTSNEVDMEELWDFFFDADFIYPQKYKSLHSMKESFRTLYRRLYEESPEIANHFVYQKNGKIYGHIAMLRAYQRTWMVHHHAARPLGGRAAGLMVLKNLIVYLNDLYRMPSANMDYVITYYRPGNKFPDRIFGGFVRDINDPRKASLDMFTYLTFPDDYQAKKLPRGWNLRECNAEDLWEFEQFYSTKCGGLFWSLMNPESSRTDRTLEEIFAENGFRRRWKSLVLTFRDDPQAFVFAEESDVGINLSNLLNGFKIFIVNPRLERDILFSALSKLAYNTFAKPVSVLVYSGASPDFAEQLSTDFDTKQYLLWTLNMEHASEYIKYLGRKYRIRVL